MNAKLYQFLESDCKLLVAFSGGKDSVAMVLYLFELGIDPSRIELHHHIVDGKDNLLFDWSCTTSYCQSFADAFNLPIIFSWRDGGIMREIFRYQEGLQDVYYYDNGLFRLLSRKGNSTRMKFPAVSADLRTRWCSSVVKIDVLSRVINHKYKSGNYLVLTGERREESHSRNKYLEFEQYRSWTKSRDIWQYRPVIDFKESDVWNLYKKYKVQPHPCYELGWSRCSCQMCIFSSANTWASIYQLNPEKVEKFISIENKINHTLYHKLSIWDKVKKGKSFIRDKDLERWKSEAIGVFKSPILISDFKLPTGAYSREKTGSI